MNDDESQSLPFDVEIERVPAWVHASSAAVVVVGVLVATRLVPMLAFLPFLIASSVGRRFASSAAHVEVDDARLDLNGRHISREEILDVWMDEEDVDSQVTVAFSKEVELAVLHFANRAQARRFVRAAVPESAPDTRTLVAGHKPRPVDALAPLRFVAIAAAFLGTGSGYGLFVLVFFGLGAWVFVRARQVVAKPDELELRSAFGTSAYRYASVENVDVDTGRIRLKDGSALDVPRSAIRDTTLASPASLDRARRRVLEEIRRRSSE